MEPAEAKVSKKEYNKLNIDKQSNKWTYTGPKEIDFIINWFHE